VALYGCLLRNSPHVGVFTWEDMMLMAAQYHDPADPLQAEFNGLVQATGRIYGAGRKKKRTGAK
jgi:hypothetical protein